MGPGPLRRDRETDLVPGAQLRRASPRHFTARVASPLGMASIAHQPDPPGEAGHRVRPPLLRFPTFEGFDMKHRSLVMACSAAIALMVASVGPAGAAPAPAPVGWTPTPGAQWQWQLQGKVDLSPAVGAFDIDGFDTRPETVAAIHAKRAHAVCYISAGTWENWRPDAAAFPSSVKGLNVAGWKGESWLDISNWAVLGPIMTARMQMCRNKGFDAVEPDNVDGFQNSTGFPLTGDQQIAYNTNIATTAHTLGLSVALKNDVDQLAQLAPLFDFALNEECARYNECAGYSAFTSVGKAVWNVEYQSSKYPAFCKKTFSVFGQASMLKSLGLTATPRRPCLSA
jgi:hypothetical protein